MPLNLQAHLRFRFQSALLALAALVISGQSLAQDATQPANCGPRARIVEYLGARFHETVVAAGLMSEASLLEHAMSAGGESWTFFTTDSKGVSCIVSSGKAWTHVASQPAGPQT